MPTEVTSSTDYDSRQINFTYNEAGWLTTENWVSGSYTATYSYDLAGDLTGASMLLLMIPLSSWSKQRFLIRAHRAWAQSR